MIGVFLFIYIIFLGGCLFSMISKRSLFIVFFFGLLSVSPYLEYITAPGWRELGYATTFYAKAIPGIIDVVILFLFYLSGKNNASYHLEDNNKGLLLTLFFWLIFNILSLFNSLSFESSLIGFVISVVGPLFMFSIFRRKMFLKKITINRIVLVISIFIIFNISITLVGYIFSTARGVNIHHGFEFLKLGGIGIFRSNAGINYLAIFIPLIFINFKLKRTTQVLFVLAKILFLTLFIASGQRMGIAILFVLFIYYILVRGNIKQSAITIIVLIGIVLIVNVFLGDWVDYMINDRILAKSDSVMESTFEDGRFLLWSEAISLIPDNWFIGIGIANYSKIAGFVSKYVTISSAHNLYLNITIERGVFVLFIYLFVLYFIVKSNYKLAMLLKKDSDMYQLVVGLRYGIFSFMVISITGVGLFNTGGLIHAIHSYLLFSLLFFQVYYYWFLMNKVNLKKGENYHSV